MRLQYVGFYSKDKDRLSFPSAVAKMDYIIGALNEVGIDVDVISPCRLGTKKGKPQFGRYLEINKKTRLKTCFSFPEYNIFFKYLQISFSMLWLFLYLLLCVKKSDTVLAYHVIMSDKIVMLAKRIKKFKVVLEVGEIFNDVENVKITKRQAEIDTILKADGYLYSTKLLNDVCNPNQKPYGVALGAYKITPEYKNLFNDDKIHVVYAGILRKDKGVDLAIETAKHLDSNYFVHILGYGDEKDIERVKKEVETVNNESESEVRYEGLLHGEEYNQFIQSCSFGLCTQSSDVNYNTTAFPSKVISYLSNGLTVIAVKIKSLELSEVSELLCLYDNSTNQTEQIAGFIKTVKRTPNTRNEIRTKISQLDDNFKSQLKTLFPNYII